VTEAEHCSKALQGLFSDDHGWFCSFPMVVEGLNALEASTVPLLGLNSVWAVVNHLLFWQKASIRFLQGHPEEDWLEGDFYGWPPIEDPEDEQAWHKACQQLLRANRSLAGIAAVLSQEELEECGGSGKARRWQVLYGLIAHNSYHICEIISIRQMLGLPLKWT
jgi:hypothetical protein